MIGWLEWLRDFFSMGGYALYVWPAYGVMALVLLLNVALPLRREKKLLQRLRQLHKEQPGGRDAS